MLTPICGWLGRMNVANYTLFHTQGCITLSEVKNKMRKGHRKSGCEEWLRGVAARSGCYDI